MNLPNAKRKMKIDPLNSAIRSLTIVVLVSLLSTNSLIFLCVNPEENITDPTPTSIKEIPYSSVLHSLLGNITGKSTAKMDITVATNNRDL
jgi:hypothetical protein